jgi:hypothetical protein
MKLQKWLENWDMTGLKIKTPFLEAEWNPQTADQNAAWDLYIEMLTRIITQPLPNDVGDEKAALDSVYSLFPETRRILKHYGRDCIAFTKIAIVVLNQIVRPFTAKWHSVSLAGQLSAEGNRQPFRTELAALQIELRKYARALAEMAKVEDLTNLEDV